MRDKQEKLDSHQFIRSRRNNKMKSMEQKGSGCQVAVRRVKDVLGEPFLQYIHDNPMTATPSAYCWAAFARMAL